MTIVYSVVAGPGGVILAEFSSTDGNFSAVVLQILQNLPTNGNGKKTYTFQGFNFHTVMANQMVFICVAKEGFPTHISYGFLDDIQLLWRNKYGSKGTEAIAFAMNDEFSRILKTKMDFYSNDTSADKVRAINAQLEEVRNQLMYNLEKVIERGENIEKLVTKTEKLQTESAVFKHKAVEVKKKFWWQNVKLYIVIFIILIIVIYGIAAGLCGPTLEKCLRSEPQPQPQPQPPQPEAPTPTPTPTHSTPTHPPSDAPTTVPSDPPSDVDPPTGAPSEAPTDVPTGVPVESPTEAPTEHPTDAPAEAPTEIPTEQPTETPTEVPTETPTEAPTEVPTEAPTGAPIEAPTETPTAEPTEVPTEAPTESPTAQPTEAPTTITPTA
eukprot:TRINITY_DN2078_c2_g1_i1.p1 TRINITY_DN2078_c2_g1~~TRINITY_DN2078_c2_g1_i1.p1  ORF type:complete len:382 (+),score=113.94 TRINITY_DN2078_c2_g1_i1:20-1165(+)